MLRKLRLENIAIVEAAEVELAEGLVALTGETGSGKSVLIGGLELALGGRGSADLVRAGKSVAAVEATFEPPLPKALAALIRDELGLEWAPGEPLQIRREISSQGRSRAFIAGQLVNASDLRRAGELLVDLHGQHEHQSLFHLAAQTEALDAFAGNEKQLAAYEEAYEAHATLRRRAEELAAEAADYEKRADFLDFQIGELDSLSPREGETTELEAEEARLANAETLAEAAARAHALLYEGSGEEGFSALSALREARRALEQIGAVDPSMSGAAEKCAEIEALAEDLAFAARDYAGRCEADPARLAEVSDRLEALSRMRRKHGAADEAALAAILAALRAEREKMTLDERERGEIGAKLAAAKRELGARAERLSRARAEAAGKLAAAVEKTLGKVGMEKARFQIAVAPSAEPGPGGADRVEFLLAANPGEGAKPLRETASGGELSRTMLAIKAALARKGRVPTLVFDEIDAGISGETAARVGRVMEDLAASHQILCITHHAAIAARAGRHLSVRKSASGGRTRMETAALEKEERLEELARMMGGDGASAAGRQLAKQLLAAGGSGG